MPRSIAEMTHAELMVYKLHLHHLQRDFRFEQEKTDHAARIQRIYYLIRRIDTKLDRVYAELARRPRQEFPLQ